MAKNEELNNILRRIKFNYNLKQSEIASKIGVSSTYLSDTLNGRAEFNDTLRSKIYEAFSDINPNISTVSGSNNTSVAGDGNQVNSSLTLDKALNENSEMRKLLERALNESSEMRKLLEKAIQNNKEQADSFFAIIGNLTK